jgi:hypothetical protein
MEYLSILIVVWLGSSIGLLVALHGRLLAALWREPVLKQPVLIVESDDWGPGPDADAEALRALAGMLESVRDRAGHPAVMTLGVVAGVPDGPAIRASGGINYARRTLAEPEFAALVGVMRAGVASGVFALQRHGLEHFWPATLLARLAGGSVAGTAEAAKNGEPRALRDWLGTAHLRSEALPSALQSRWVDCSHLPSARLDPHEVETAVREETALLRQLFGVAPDVAVPNTFVWDDGVELAWAASGVRCLVTPGCRYEGRDAAGLLAPATLRIRNGERSRTGMCYVVRDVYFEPVRGHRAERVWQALDDRVAQGRPALLETHRESFIGMPDTCRAALAELERALQGALVRHPALRFMSTSELARELRDADSALRVRALGPRLAAWFARVQADASLSRILKFTGLAVVLRLFRGLLRSEADHRTRGAQSC